MFHAQSAGIETQPCGNKDSWMRRPGRVQFAFNRRLLVHVISLFAVPGETMFAQTSDVQCGRTSLSNPAIQYKSSARHYIALRGGDVEAVVVDNAGVDDQVLPGHHEGYSGLGSLRHRGRAENLFVPAYAGLNFEHCHDGTKQERSTLFEVRSAPMSLRVVNEHVAELHQPPTPHYRLESCIRYELLPDGAIEMTIECIPRERAFRNGYIGLFFASYINHPESLDIHFRGRDDGQGVDNIRWVRGVTPKHGQEATHRSVDDQRDFAHDPDFPLSLAFNFSRHRYTEPWYYGVSHGMVLAFIFRPEDRVRLTQSPSGGGAGCPAWDFQWFIPDYQVGRCYAFVMRAMYVPFESTEQIANAAQPHRRALVAATTTPAAQ